MGCSSRGHPHGPFARGGSAGAPGAQATCRDYAAVQLPMFPEVFLLVQQPGEESRGLIGTPLQQGTQLVLVELGVQVAKPPVTDTVGSQHPAPVPGPPLFWLERATPGPSHPHPQELLFASTP